MILGDQLFHPEFLHDHQDLPIFMAEDWGLCTRVKHHQQKLVLFLAAMRCHARVLESRGWRVDYRRLDPGDRRGYCARLADAIKQGEHDELVHFEIEDRFMAAAIDEMVKGLGIRRRVLQSPGFLTSRRQFEDYLDGQDKPFMATFYQRQRERLGVLLEPDGRPRGGRWSFDKDNRNRLPKDHHPPDLPEVAADPLVGDVIDLVRQHFTDHPGDAREFDWPVTAEQAESWLDAFIDERLDDFGPFQDAMTRHHDSLYHSALSPLLNMGLLTPHYVLDRVLEAADEPGRQIPLSSLEGFIRQLIGWREFVRGVDAHLGEEQAAGNAWDNHGRLTRHWYDGSTGIPPLDDAIRQAMRMGWTHHIQRLMVIANLMNLAGIAPDEVYRWFMETHIDSADWVMGPNVYGMGLASDGGRMVTKPYVCGSNYLLKMSDYERGPWCDVVDGLYWRFVDRHREAFARNPRLAVMPRSLDRLNKDRRDRIFAAAESFIEEYVA